MKEKLAQNTVHPAAKKDCRACHQPHASAQPRLATDAAVPLCGQCHDLQDAKFSRSHLGIKAVDMNCMSCHDPHASKSAKFFKETVHPPFAGNACDECHIVQQGAK
jgi:predicted CXXCH cytochrome family protein